MLEGIFEIIGRIFIEIIFEFLICGIFKIFYKIFHFTGLGLMSILPNSKVEKEHQKKGNEENHTPAWLGLLFYMRLNYRVFCKQKLSPNVTQSRKSN